MLNQRLDAARHVAPELFAAESGIDEAILKSLTLMGSLLAARAEAGLAATVGHEAVTEAGGVLTVLFDARHRVVATHQGLAEVKTDIGLAHFAVGNGGQKPDQMRAEPRSCA